MVIIMETITIKIKKDNLKLNNGGSVILIEEKSDSGLYFGSEYEVNENGDLVNPSETRLTRSELKRICDVNVIDETLDMIENMESEKIYTDDEINFISQYEYESLSDSCKYGYKKVEYVVED